MFLGAAAEAHPQPRAGDAQTTACALLTRDVVRQATLADALRGASAPQNVRLAATGSACEWGDVLLVIDQYSPAELDKVLESSGQNWTAVSGVGDAAYTHNLRNMIAEVMGRIGSHTFAIQVTIPTPGGVAAAEAGALNLARAIVPRLR